VALGECATTKVRYTKAPGTNWRQRAMEGSFVPMETTIRASGHKDSGMAKESMSRSPTDKLSKDNG
jgi:hypothetical protein